MKREIYEVTAKIVDANGSFNTLSGYPKAFDSKNYNNDVDKTFNRAMAEYSEVLGAMYKRDDRPLQLAMITRMSDGAQYEVRRIGEMPEIPDPAPVVEDTQKFPDVEDFE